MADTAELPLEEPVVVTSAGELRARLRRKFPADQYAMLYEVRDAAGFGASRSADVVMVGLWPSRGCLIEGMEIKVSRSDWLRELKKPEKAEAFVPYCDRWWIVAGHAGVVKLDELPPTWGLLAPGGKGLSVLRQAPALDPKPVDRSLLAAMLKRATSTTMDSPEIKAAIDARVKAEKEALKSMGNWEIDRLKDQVEAAQKNMRAFEEASGIRIESYNGQRIGDAVRQVLRGEHLAKLNEARGMRDRIVKLAEYMQREFPEPSSENGTGVVLLNERENR